MTPQRYGDLLTAVNGRAVQQGIFLVPVAQDMPLGEDAELPSGPPGTIDIAITPGDWNELIGYADRLGIDISLF